MTADTQEVVVGTLVSHAFALISFGKWEMSSKVVGEEIGHSRGYLYGANNLDRRSAISALHLFAKLSQLLNHNLMVIPLLQPTHDDYRNRPIAVLDVDRHATTMDCIVFGRLAQSHLCLELLLVALKLVLQTPCTRIEANDSCAFPANPEIVV